MINHYDSFWWTNMTHHDEPSWFTMMNHHDSFWWIVMIHHDESSWFIIVNLHDSSWWIIMMSHHDSAWWTIMTHHDEPSWFFMMNHHDASWWIWIIMMHRAETSQFMLMIHHDSPRWIIMIHHDESSWCIAMNHHDAMVTLPHYDALGETPTLRRGRGCTATWGVKAPLVAFCRYVEKVLPVHIHTISKREYREHIPLALLTAQMNGWGSGYILASKVVWFLVAYVQGHVYLDRMSGNLFIVFLLCPT